MSDRPTTRYFARDSRSGATLVLEAVTPEKARLAAANTWHVPQGLVEVVEVDDLGGAVEHDVEPRPRLKMTTNGVHVLDLTHEAGRYVLVCERHPYSTTLEVDRLMDAANYARARGSAPWCAGCEGGEPDAPLTPDELAAM